jgi:hypothetical protein
MGHRFPASRAAFFVSAHSPLCTEKCGLLRTNPQILARPVLLEILEMLIVVNKSHRIILHLSCMVAKTWKGRDCAWHWQHLLREFGCGEYTTRGSRLKSDSKLEAVKCST